MIRTNPKGYLMTDKNGANARQYSEEPKPEIWNADAYRKAAKEFRHEAARALAATINNLCLAKTPNTPRIMRLVRFSWSGLQS